MSHAGKQKNLLFLQEGAQIQMHPLLVHDECLSVSAALGSFPGGPHACSHVQFQHGPHTWKEQTGVKLTEPKC